jgi:hypothetical protein
MNQTNAIVPAGLGARADFVGYRDKGLIFRCACGCGGHAMVDRAELEALDTYIATRPRAPRWAEREAGGRGGLTSRVYITDHQPLGIAAEKIRVGARVALRATT